MRAYTILNNILENRFQGSDFSSYFNFLESLPVIKKSLGVHRHHILPKKEFPEQAKNSQNLVYLTTADHFKAHYYLALCAPDCLSFQRVFFIMANTKAQEIQIEDLPNHVKIYEEGRTEQIRQARTRGYKSAIEGTGVCAPGMAAKGGRKGGPVAGRKAIPRLAAIRTPEHQSKAGRAAGRKAVESGEWDRIRNLPQTKAAQSKTGKKLGDRMAKTGRLPELSLMGNHVQWHVNRGVVEPDCPLCL
jgi:hypothetical protein